MAMFEGWDAVVLARAQFAFTMSFHIIFPAFSIGLASYLAVLEALWLATGREVYINLFNYWLKIFAVADNPASTRPIEVPDQQKGHDRAE